MLNTYCKGCVFAEVKDGAQTSCSINKLPEQFETIDNFFSFQKYCRYYRDGEWLKECDEDPKNKVENENAVKIGIAINFIGNYSISDLVNTLKSLKEAFYVIVVNDKPEYNKDIFNAIQLNTNIVSSKIHIVQIINQVEKYYIDEAFRFARNGWFLYVQSGEILSPMFYSKLNKLANQNDKTVSIVYDDNKMLFMSILFKFLGGNKQKIDADGNIDSLDFLQRAEATPKNEQCIYQWKEVFDV